MATLKGLVNVENIFLVLIILIEFILVVAISISMRILQWRRAKRLLYEVPIKERITQLLVDVSMGLMEAKGFDALGLRKKDRPILRDCTIGVIQSLHLNTRKPLVDLYRELGFFRRDLKDLKSLSFAKQISALARLDLLQEDDSIPAIQSLLKSKSDYLRFGALRFLVRKGLNHIPDFNLRFNELLRKQRFDTMIEIVASLAVFQRSYFIQAFPGVKNREVKLAFLKVIYKHRIAEALPLVRSSLETTRIGAAGDLILLKKHLLCLTISPEPDSETVLRALSSHPNLEIRFLALCSLLVLRPDEKPLIAQELSKEKMSGLLENFENFAATMGRIGYG